MLNTQKVTRTHTQILSRYVKKNALFSILFAVIGLWLLQLFFSYLAELEDISDAYTYFEAIKYISYRSPYFLEQFIPTGALLGAVVGLGMLANNSELVIMRSAGISIYRIVGWVLQPALLFVFISLGINQFVLPYSNQLASQIRNPDKPLLTSVSGYWSFRQTANSIKVDDESLLDESESTDHSKNGLTSEIIFIDYADANGNVGVVKRWQLDDNNNLVSALKAQDGHYIDMQTTYTETVNTNKAANMALDNNAQSNASAYLWQLNGISEVHINSSNVGNTSSPANPVNESSVTQTPSNPNRSVIEDNIINNNVTNNVNSIEQFAKNDDLAIRQSTYFDSTNRQPLVNQTKQPSASMHLPLSPSSVYLLTQRAEDLSLTELYQHYRFNLTQGTRSLEHELAFWQKLLSPFAILSLVIVACSFVFGSLRTHSLGLRIVVALLFGLLFSYLQDLSGFISLATGISPLIMVVIPIIASAVLGLFLIKRQM